MAVQLNHTIVAARDKEASATFLAELLGLPDPAPFGPFMTVQVANDVTLDFVDAADSGDSTDRVVVSIGYAACPQFLRGKKHAKIKAE